MCACVALCPMSRHLYPADVVLDAQTQGGGEVRRGRSRDGGAADANRRRGAADAEERRGGALQWSGAAVRRTLIYKGSAAQHTMRIYALRALRRLPAAKAQPRDPV